MVHNFAVIGVGGYIAPRHLRAIRDTGHHLVAAVDTHDAVGLLDQFGFNVRFFTEIERFDRHLEKLRRGPEQDRVHYVSVCSPNYLHDAHCRLALRSGAAAICEKPLVINPWNLDALQALEEETGRRVYTVLQLRLHPALIALRERLASAGQTMHHVELRYVTARGGWYDVSWKGTAEKSGGIVTNIGIHLFDLLVWLFGAPTDVRVHVNERRRAGGVIHLARARVRWYLSAESSDVPAAAAAAGRTTFRSIRIDGYEVEFTEGFTDLHTRVYEETLAGRGFGIGDARASIELVHRIRHTPVTEAEPDDRAWLAPAGADAP